MDEAPRWVSWNPVTGCTRVSDGCLHCYAQRFAERWRGIAGHPYERGFDLQLRPERLELPQRWRKPRRVFVTSMSDLFHEGVPDELHPRGVRRHGADAAPHLPRAHQAASARAGRWRPRCRGRPTCGWASPWRATATWSAPTPCGRCRPPCATSAPSPCSVRSTRSISQGIDWVIAGGESGPARRPPDPQWLRDLRDRCLAAGVAFYFKGWGGRTQGQLGRLLDGREWLQRPPTCAERARRRRPGGSSACGRARRCPQSQAVDHERRRLVLRALNALELGT